MLRWCSGWGSKQAAKQVEKGVPVTLRPRLAVVVVAIASTLVLAAGPALAGHCTVVDKKPDAGVQVILDASDGLREATPIWFSQGVEKRMEKFGPREFFTKFHGWIGFDTTGNGEVDWSMLVPGHTGEDGIPKLPESSYENGPECHGTVTIHDFLENCFG